MISFSRGRSVSSKVASIGKKSRSMEFEIHVKYSRRNWFLTHPIPATWYLFWYDFYKEQKETIRPRKSTLDLQLKD